MSGEGSKPATGDGGQPERHELFISYSRHDEHWLADLRDHLSSLESTCNLQVWDDSHIQPGEQWREEIEKALARAKLALLLVSQKFLVSEFIRKEELPSILHSAENNGLKILWLPLNPCTWKRHPVISRYQCILEKPALSLEERSKVDQAKAMVEITDKIEAICVSISEQRATRQDAVVDHASAQHQQEKERLAEAEWGHQREELAHLERLKAESEARAEVERLLAEAEKLRAEVERSRIELEQSRAAAEQSQAEVKRLAQKKEEWQGKAQALIEIRTNRGWLVQEGKEWKKKEEAITVSGYREQLAEGIAISMLRIPEGEFLMGSPESEAGHYRDEGPQHRVTLGSFFLGQTPVTQAQWKVVAGFPKLELELPPNPFAFQGADHPVEQVSWEEAMEFCRRLSQHTGKNYTLPSEAQWEYACRAGTTTPFTFGNTLTSEIANYAATSNYGSGHKGVYREKTTAVGSFPANAWGLQDMHGNVWEWCLDAWHDTYQAAPTDGSAWTAAGKGRRLLRGGSWDNLPRDCRSAYRSGVHSVDRDRLVGFRLCCLPQDLFLYT